MALNGEDVLGGTPEPSTPEQDEAAAHEAVAAARDGVPEKTTAPAEMTDASAGDPADL